MAVDDGKKAENKSEESEHESEDESEILEESPCGRWLKRSEEVSQRNVPGIDRAYLAMDSEEGVEVVWNEVQFSERKSFKQQEEKIKAVFDNLMRIDHANIVKFHRYWIDYSKEQQKTRVVFITEYMSSGSVKEFLNKTKELQTYKRTKSWKRWCTQILSALSYLHNCNPSVIHGNMTCDTIFIQHNGLVKIGSVAPDAIRNHVKTYHEVKRHMHYYAPEYEGAPQDITPAVDIYSFGICALEMAVPRSQLKYTESKTITPADIERAIDVLENPQQKDFIRLCLCEDPKKRPSARSLLLHPLLFEVHSLKLLAAHAFVKNQRILPEYKQADQNKEMVIAETTHATTRLKDIPAFDIDKFLEDVLNGVYPLTSYALPQPPWVPTSSAPQQAEGKAVEGHKPSGNGEEIAFETRKIIHVQGTITPLEKSLELTLQLRFEDKMNRHLNCEISYDDSAETLSGELVEHKLIKEGDEVLVKQLLEEMLKSHDTNKGTVHMSSGHFLGAEQAFPNALMSALQGQQALNDASFLFYPNIHGQVLTKPQSGAIGPDYPNVSSSPTQPFSAFPTMHQNVSAPPQAITTVLSTQPHSTPFLGSSVLQQHQAAPMLANHIDNSNSTSNLASQLASHRAATVLPVPLQYMQILSPQMLQQIQPIYAHQTLIQQPSQLQGNLASQPTGSALNQINQPLIAASVPPGMTSVAGTHDISNGGMFVQTRPLTRMPNDQAQRPTNVYVVGQQQVQSSNNSNNTTFSRSTSRVDDATTQHTSVASTISSLSDVDVGGSKTPPTSISGDLSFKAT